MLLTSVSRTRINNNYISAFIYSTTLHRLSSCEMYCYAVGIESQVRHTPSLGGRQSLEREKGVEYLRPWESAEW